MQGIYAIVHRDTQRCYVGQSINCPKRLREHVALLSRGAHDNPRLQNAWTKYGADAFDTELLTECNFLPILDALEENLVARLGYYNMREGGQSKRHNLTVAEKVAQQQRSREAVLRQAEYQRSYGEQYRKANRERLAANARKRRVSH